MNYIIAAIFTNLAYAVADNFNGIIAKKNSPLKVSVWVTFFGTVIFMLPALFIFQDEISKLTIENLLLIIGIDIFVVIGYLSFIMGMSKGSVMLTGVIGGSFPAVTTVIALIFFGEKVSIYQAGTIALILFGIVLSSMHGKVSQLFTHIKTSALVYAFGAFFLWGIYFALIRIPVERVGWFMPQYLSNVLGLIIYLVIATKIMKEKHIFSKPRHTSLIAVVAVLQILGGVLFNYALTKGSTAIVAPIAGSSPAVFAILAFFIFNEKLTKLQVIGVVITLIGIVGLSSLSNYQVA